MNTVRRSARPTLIHRGAMRPLRWWSDRLACGSWLMGRLSILLGVIAPVSLALGITALCAGQSRSNWSYVRKQATKGIIVSLAAMLLWSSLISLFQRVRELTRSETCYANLMQMGNAITQYSQDYDEHLPLSGCWVNTVGPNMMDLGRIPACPDALFPSRGYAFNVHLSGASLERIDNPSQLVMFFDANSGLYPFGGPERMDFRHNGSCIIAYADGHVHSVRLHKTPLLRWIPVQNSLKNYPSNSNLLRSERSNKKKCRHSGEGWNDK